MANSVERDLERAEVLHKQASKLAKRNPSAAKKLKAKANAIENKAVSRLGRKPSRKSSSNSTRGGNVNRTLDFY